MLRTAYSSSASRAQVTSRYGSAAPKPQSVRSDDPWDSFDTPEEEQSSYSNKNSSSRDNYGQSQSSRYGSSSSSSSTSSSRGMSLGNSSSSSSRPATSSSSRPSTGGDADLSKYSNARSISSAQLFNRDESDFVPQNRSGNSYSYGGGGGYGNGTPMIFPYLVTILNLFYRPQCHLAHSRDSISRSVKLKGSCCRQD